MALQIAGTVGGTGGSPTPPGGSVLSTKWTSTSGISPIVNKGWSWNSDYEYEIALDGNGHALVPSGALWVDPSYPTYDFVVRADTSDNNTRKLYDREDKTFVLTVNPVKVDVVWSADFENIPQVARDYIATRAARRVST